MNICVNNFHQNSKIWLLAQYLTDGESSSPGRPLVWRAILFLPFLPPVETLEARVQAARVRLPPRLEGHQVGHVRGQ